MKMIIVLAAIIAVACAVPVPQEDNEVTILRYDNDNIGVDSYKYALVQHIIHFINIYYSLIIFVFFFIAKIVSKLAMEHPKTKKVN